jgi:hypothetical protein
MPSLPKALPLKLSKVMGKGFSLEMDERVNGPKRALGPEVTVPSAMVPVVAVLPRSNQDGVEAVASQVRHP